MPSDLTPWISSPGSGGNQHAGADDDSERGILERWQITADDLTKVVDENPSLRGILFGYVAERKLSQLLEAHADVSGLMKYDDHDRTHKGDRVVTYKGHKFSIECKSLQTKTVKRVGDQWVGRAQVDASDRRTVRLPDGSTLETTLLLVGEFDVLAVNLFAFRKEWRFVFAKNADLPTSTYHKYGPEQRKHLIASLVRVTWPPEPPFHGDIFDLLGKLAQERSR